MEWTTHMPTLFWKRLNEWKVSKNLMLLYSFAITWCGKLLKTLLIVTYICVNQAVWGITYISTQQSSILYHIPIPRPKNHDSKCCAGFLIP